MSRVSRGKSTKGIGRPYEPLHNDEETPTPTSPGSTSGVRCKWRWICHIHEILALALMPSPEPSVRHVTIVIFLEFFAWGLVATILPEAITNYFGSQEFWMVWGLTQGLKGFLSFLSAPFLGAFSDAWGRKPFLLLTVACTCLPLPFLLLHNLWFHVIAVAISGAFAVTFSIVFAYVSDITTDADRNAAYGQVSATFAASLVISPALGSLFLELFGPTALYLIATMVAAFDVFYIYVYVPESMKTRQMVQLQQIRKVTLASANPFGSMRVVFQSAVLMKLAVMVFFSYLPEAGQYACLMLYLQNSIMFTKLELAGFIAVLGILGIIAQTFVLLIYRCVVPSQHLVARFFRHSHPSSLNCKTRVSELTLFGLVSSKVAIFAVTVVAALGSMTYPSISAMVSQTAGTEQQGVVQGTITGIRSLCTGLGPALFGSLFQFTDAPLEADPSQHAATFPGAPFLAGAVLVLISLMVALTLPDKIQHIPSLLPSNSVEMANLDKEFLAKAKDIEDSDDDERMSRRSNSKTKESPVPSVPSLVARDVSPKNISD